METRGSLSIDPGSIDPGEHPGDIEVVVPYTEFGTTRAVLERAARLTAGLSVRLALVAVHTVPYPADFACPSAVHSFLVERLLELSSMSRLPADAQVVLARTRIDGFRHVLRPESTVLVGSPRRLWRTGEEKLARELALDGHKVVLVHVREDGLWRTSAS